MTTPSEPTPSMLLAAIHSVFGRLDTIDGRLEGIDGRLDGMERRLCTVEDKLVDLRTETANGFIESNRQNTHTAQLIAATSGGITGVARQLIDHLGKHAT